VLLQIMDSRELTEWVALDKLRAEERSEAKRESEMLARLKANMSKGRR